MTQPYHIWKFTEMKSVYKIGEIRNQPRSPSVDHILCVCVCMYVYIYGYLLGTICMKYMRSVPFILTEIGK